MNVQSVASGEDERRRDIKVCEVGARRGQPASRNNSLIISKHS